MPEAYFYSTQPFLAWCLNHYFYGRRHYVWVASPFYPYKMPNPKSSNPYMIYADLYAPWRDQDPHDRFVGSLRLSLRAGIIFAGRLLSPGVQSRLKRICQGVDSAFFYPIVYRVDTAAIDQMRLNGSKGSAEMGSNEYLIEDLGEDEFDVLFLEYRDIDVDMRELAKGTVPADEVLLKLEGRC